MRSCDSEDSDEASDARNCVTKSTTQENCHSEHVANSYPRKRNPNRLPATLTGRKLVGSDWLLGNVVCSDDLAQIVRLHHTKSRQLLCLRILRDEHKANPNLQDLFRQSNDCWRTLDHNNIQAVHNPDEAGDQLVLENVVGPISDCLAFQPPLEQLISWLIDVSSALECFGCSTGLIHGSLSLNTLLVTRIGDIKLSPSGFDKQQECGLPQPTCNLTHHPPEMFSPEHFGKVGTQFDMFRFGMLAQDLLAGDSHGPTFTSRCKYLRREEIIASIVSPEPHARFESIFPHLPPKIAEILNACVEKEVRNRPQNFREIIACLRCEANAPLQGSSSGRNRQLTITKPTIVWSDVRNDTSSVRSRLPTSDDQPFRCRWLAAKTLVKSRWRMAVLTALAMVLLPVIAAMTGPWPSAPTEPAATQSPDLREPMPQSVATVPHVRSLLAELETSPTASILATESPVSTIDLIPAVACETVPESETVYAPAPTIVSESVAPPARGDSAPTRRPRFKPQILAVGKDCQAISVKVTDLLSKYWLTQSPHFSRTVNQSSPSSLEDPRLDFAKALLQIRHGARQDDRTIELLRKAINLAPPQFILAHRQLALCQIEKSEDTAALSTAVDLVSHISGETNAELIDESIEFAAEILGFVQGAADAEEIQHIYQHWESDLRSMAIGFHTDVDFDATQKSMRERTTAACKSNPALIRQQLAARFFEFEVDYDRRLVELSFDLVR